MGYGKKERLESYCLLNHLIQIIQTQIVIDRLGQQFSSQ